MKGGGGLLCEIEIEEGVGFFRATERKGKGVLRARESRRGEGVMRARAGAGSLGKREREKEGDVRPWF